MIKASEARANVERYIQDTIEASLSDIERQIIDESTQGKPLTRAFYNEFNDQRILNKIIDALAAAGYRVENRAEFKYLLIQWS